jgi:SWI/SNF-related matrix-associated actin-dependent regulator of chromatin subfamily A3
VKRLVPLRDPAPLKGRRRPTLLVCPTSLISHWCQEIDKHVDPSVRLRVKIHYGSSKALTGADLNSYDLVITTYGTLGSEFIKDDDTSPLQRAKFLRVVLDEGHYIKNHRTKCAKAAYSLNTERRWVITGTPIQNNLLELWSLTHWLGFGLYADHLQTFKDHIEKPCKNMDPRGFERLQVLMDAICLRRTKNDRKPNGEPIVALPSKTIKIRDVELTENERVYYNILNDDAAQIVIKYQRRGDLLRNYAHIFALMMRMRQMCCHRELIQTIDWSENRDVLEREVAKLASQDELGGGGTLSDEEAQQHLVVQLRNMLRSGVTDECRWAPLLPSFLSRTDRFFSRTSLFSGLITRHFICMAVLGILQFAVYFLPKKASLNQKSSK